MFRQPPRTVAIAHGPSRGRSTQPHPTPTHYYQRAHYSSLANLLLRALIVRRTLMGRFKFALEIQQEGNTGQGLQLG